MTIELSAENRRWLDDFRGRQGRSPRVLHIGNIANNAFNNARLLNDAGLDCDVICYDYYHVMGCPEWEDADFTGGIEDDFRPNWTRVALGEYVRPRWFAQGPMELCLRYLTARRTGHSDEEWLWTGLLVASRCSAPSWLWRLDPRRLVYSEPVRSKWQLLTGDATSSIGRMVKYVSRKAVGEGKLALLSAILPVLLLARAVARPADAIFRWWRSPSLFSFSSARWSISFPAQLRLLDQWKNEFAGRADQMVADDIEPYLYRNEEWQRFLRNYDYVLGYSTDAIFPLVCGTPYFAFEHGTIREIPYQANSQGRLTALAYRLAQHVFVTNFDCVGSAENLAPGRFSIINHPYDEDHGLKVSGWERIRDNLFSELDSDFLFFHPTRQDWVEGTGFADKSNDVFLRAFAALRGEGFKVGLVCCAWGSNVQQAKILLDELGCSAYVRWVAPMAITPFERMCLATDMVVDQFKLGAFGGVTFKAMAVGTPILTYLDEQRLLRQYPECPPVLNCRTTEEIVVKTRQVIASSDELDRMGKAARTWMKTFHAKEATVNAQVDQFRRHLPISAPGNFYRNGLAEPNF